MVRTEVSKKQLWNLNFSLLYLLLKKKPSLTEFLVITRVNLTFLYELWQVNHAQLLI